MLHTSYLVPFRPSRVLMLLLLLSLFTFERSAAAAQCGMPSISNVSHVVENGQVKITFDYAFPSADGDNYVQLWYGGAQWTDDTVGQSGSATGTIATWCWATGAHTIGVAAYSCGRHWDPQYVMKANVVVDVDTTPQVDNLTVTVSETGAASLSVNYDFPNTQSSSQRQLQLWIDGTNVQTYEMSAKSGVWTLPALDLSCLPEGSHTITVWGIACGKWWVDSYKDRAAATVQIQSKPSVEIEQIPDTNTFNVTYEFPHTNSHLQRSIQVTVDGSVHSSYSPSQISGSFVVNLGSTCWRELEVVAASCGRSGDSRYTDTARLESAQIAPAVTVELMKSDDLSKGRYQADIHYSLGQEIAGRGVRVTRMRWLDASGQEIAKQTFEPFGTTGPLTGAHTLYFTPPVEVKQVHIDVEARACGIATASASIECDCPEASLDPVYFANGNMQLSDTDPLPAVGGYALTRTYDSDEQVSGRFGRGFTTLFDQRLVRDAIGARQIASIVTSRNDVVIFEGIGGVWRQKWPATQRESGTLSYDGVAGTYTYRAGGSTQELVFRSSDGKLTTVRDWITGREGRITYSGTVPATFADSWSDVQWTLTTSSGRVTSVSVNTTPALTWKYIYDTAGNLTAVLAPGEATWRTYEYSSNRMTASRDAAGNLIESHAYDAAGYAIDSTGPGDEIASIQYNLPGSAARERVTRVTMKSGAVTDYILRPVGGALRVVQVIGACISCGGGAGDKTLVRDARGRIIREQGPDGYISVTTYDGERLMAEERSLAPVGCDPATDQCRMDTDELADAVLRPTTATTRSEYIYGDARWPDKPTAIVTPSVAAEGETRREELVYHPRTGAVVVHGTTGYTGKSGEEAVQTTQQNTTVYEQRPAGDDGTTGLSPAFAPGGAFDPDWLALPQPSLRIKSVDGPRLDVADVTSFVYYPVHSSVAALLRGHLAATQNAAGHVTRYEAYDAFGNVTRVVDPNGVATEMTYDALGRLATSTVKGVAGCNSSKDALCGVDLTTTRTYEPAAGPLQREQRPGGGVAVYSYDERGRVRTISRGPSAIDLREQIETSYDPLTGKKSVERTLGFEGGAWLEKTHQKYTYTPLGELATIVHADQSSVAYSYDAAGRIATARDENHTSANTKYAYDAAGRVATVAQKLTGVTGGWIETRYAYDLHGNLASVTDPNGNVTTYAYDDFGRVIRQQSPVTGTTRYDYDTAGNLLRVTDANGITTARTYDRLGRVLSATSGIAPLAGRRTRTDDDGRGDPPPPPPPPPPAPTRPEIVTWTYDDPAPGRFGVGRLTSMSDPAGTTLYDYERRGFLGQEQRTFGGCFVTRDSGTNCDEYFDSRTFVTGYRYDADGNRSSIEYPSNKLKVNYAFDHAGRPVSASGAVAAAQYLPFGPVAQLTFDNGTVQTFTYDARYRVLQNKLSGPGGVLAQYQYQHDAAGNVTAIGDLLDVRYSRSFGYDDLNRLTTANSGTALWRNGSYTWDAMGNPLTIKLGEVTPGGDDGLLRTGPRIGTESQWVPGGRTVAFTYAGATPRISHVRTTSVPPSDGGDPQPPGGEGELLRTGPRIGTHDVPSGTPVSYDAAGNETGYLVTRSYGPRNHLREVIRRSDEPGDTFEHKLLYSYDGRGLRVVRGETPSDGVSATATRYFIYTPELKLLSVSKDDVPNIWTAAAAEKDMKHEIIWFGDRPVAQVPLTGGRSYTFADHLGTPILQTSAAATVTWRAEYEPFGHIYAMRAGERADQPLRFPGQETAMAWEGQEENYNIFRWYRAGWARYTQADPIGMQGGFNLFAYALDNPLRFDDPLGLKVRMCCRIIPFTVDLGNALRMMPPGASFPPQRHCFFQFENSPNNQPLGLHGTQSLMGYINAIRGRDTGTVLTDAEFDRDRLASDVCGPWANDPCNDVDQCVRNAGGNYPSPSRYSLLGPNSNTFAFNVARQCYVKPPWPVHAPGWSAAPPQP